MRRLVLLAIALAVFLFGLPARAEEQPASAPTSAPTSLPVPVHLQTPSTCATRGGSVLDLPAGYFLADGSYLALDAEIRRLQSAEVRLLKENATLLSDLASPPGMNPKAVLILLGTGLALGMGSALLLAR